MENYSEIRKEILEKTSEMIGVVSIPDHFYTHQPDNKEIVRQLDFYIVELKELRNQIIVEE